jgi:hypothetical protein
MRTRVETSTCARVFWLSRRSCDGLLGLEGMHFSPRLKDDRMAGETR